MSRLVRATALSCAALSLVAALLAVSASGCRATQPAGRMPLNVLLITIDTLRADRLGAGIAPTLDRLADEAVWFSNTRTAVPLTLPSHTTILTGLLPPVHGVRENGTDALSDAHPTVARLLKAAGYRTAAVVGAFVLDRRFGLAQGFDLYDDRIERDPNAMERLEARRPASAVVDRTLEWLDESERTAPKCQPFFVWMHLYDPHAPYAPPPEFIARVRDVRQRSSPHAGAATGDPRSIAYDGAVAYADSQVARVLGWLRTHALESRTLVIVAGDHGEGLGDHGERTHGMLLYDSTLRVPLLIAAPGRAAARRDDPVSLADIAPTILREAGVTPPATMAHRDLLDTRQEAASGTEIYAETTYPHVAGWSPLEALTDGRWMAIRGTTSTELYDLEDDPHEVRDMAAAQASTAAAMGSRIDAIRTASPTSSMPPGARTISPDVRERLKALGYVGGTASSAPSKDAPNPAARIETWNAFEQALSVLSAATASNNRAALDQLEPLARANPDAPVIQETYARALARAGRRQAALTILRQAGRRWPTDATLLHELAVMARDAANATRGPAANALLEEASQADRAALVVAPGSATAHNGLGLIATDEQRFQEAVGEFERATTLDPNNASYWANLGNARRAIHDAAGAEHAYRQALQVDARTADAANGLGVLLVEGGRPKDAVPWFERAAAATPDLMEARLNLGIALQQSGDRRGAVRAYRAVMASASSGARERAAAARLLASLGAIR